ncbi:hypothetical protein C9374_010710 [Naegleria lovaniensis]|uniref:Uncharacterized protein n=1 Tax=Naegleria lovaniensis TaxID=51637 RepID=A0AA88GDB1_NAELO|nr:uncharacterized protein C9374_010710 [Naegleria lovaniensis]KAG2374426.1 hypothetical protein C9374_010710 [Naegleria lovaniensis]
MKLSLNMGALAAAKQSEDKISPQQQQPTSDDESVNSYTSDQESERESSNRMDTSVDEAPKIQQPTPLQKLPSFSLNLKGIGNNAITDSNPLASIVPKANEIEEEDEYSDDDLKETSGARDQSVKPSSSSSLPKFNLQMPSLPVSENTSSARNSSARNPASSFSQSESILPVDLIVPNLCTVNLSSSQNIESVLTQIESDLNSIKREDLELFILKPVVSIEDIKDANSLVCKTKQMTFNVATLSSLSKQNQELRVKHDKTSTALLNLSKENEEMRARIEELEKQKEDARKLVEQLQNQLTTLTQNM